MCVDTFAGAHLNRLMLEPGTSARCTEEYKHHKYAGLAEAHQFEPIAVETMGVYTWWVHWSYLGRETDEPKEVNWFVQNLAKAVEGGNAFSILTACEERF